ncbi:hypothetical protein [uncultured Clostridium sp.]|jgi:hypothetical protein|uniref:hypothetical protein n=1 Tax=uncultured Clostridium sp. TaxID=59620 RepID=UPI0025DE2ADC|nr:hypothetical protein [uncultured Clostridium sp.]
MKIRFLGKSGNSGNGGKRRGISQHQVNLQYLNNHSILKTNMMNALTPYIDSFFNIDRYLNSGKVSARVCEEINVLNNEFYHGLVGSLIYDAFVKINPAMYGLSLFKEITASKGEDQRYFDYFV